MKKPRILVVGSFMMDLIATTTRAPKEGETVIGLKFRTAPGGKGANQAVQCARLGADVTMVGRVGGDAFGEVLVDSARSAGIDVSHVTVDPEESTGVAQITLEVTETNALNRITVCPGANFTMTREHIAWLEKEIGNYDIVMMQLELPMAIIETVARWAKAANVPVMLNPAPAAPLSDELLSCVTYLSPNEHEAALMAGHEIDVSNGINMEDVKAVSDWFARRGVSKLIITMGENGSLIAGKDGIGHTDSVRMERVVDTTAAGDSFVAAFCVGLTAGLKEVDALAFASHAAAITVTRMGATPSLPAIEEVQALIRQRGKAGFDPEILNALKR